MPEYRTCHYCGIDTSQYELDHYPIPYERHGERVVPACVTCHDVKDRSRLIDVFPSIMRGAHKFDPHEFIQMAIVCSTDQTAAWADACWHEWSREQRLLVARILRARFLEPLFQNFTEPMIEALKRDTPEFLQPLPLIRAMQIRKKIEMVEPKYGTYWVVRYGPIRQMIKEKPQEQPKETTPVKPAPYVREKLRKKKK